MPINHENEQKVALLGGGAGGGGIKFPHLSQRLYTRGVGENRRQALIFDHQLISDAVGPLSLSSGGNFP